MNDISLLSFPREQFQGRRISHTKKAILEIILLQCTQGTETDSILKKTAIKLKKDQECYDSPLTCHSPLWIT